MVTRQQYGEEEESSSLLDSSGNNVDGDAAFYSRSSSGKRSTDFVSSYGGINSNEEKEALVSYQQQQQQHDNEAEEEDAPEAKLTLRSCFKGAFSFAGESFNLVNDIIGCGLIGVPLYVAQTGLFAALIEIIFFAIITDITLCAEFYISRKYKQASYTDMCRNALGLPGYIAACFSIFAYNFGGFVSYLLVVGEILPPLFTSFTGIENNFWMSRNMVIIYTVVLFAPVSFFKDISWFAFTSFISQASLFSIVMLVLVRGIHREPGEYVTPPPDAYQFIKPRTFLKAFGGFAFIFTCHDLAFSVFEKIKLKPRALKRRTAMVIGRWPSVVHSVILFAVFMSATMGISGYLMFYDTVAANILDSLSENDKLVIAAKCCLALAIAATVPYSTFMPRVSITSILTAVFPRTKDNTKFMNAFHVIITFAILGAALLIAEFVTDLGDLFELVGGVAAASLGFILPPLCYLRFEKGTPMHRSPGKVIMLSIFLFGVFVMVMSTGTTLYSIISSAIAKHRDHR